MLKINILYIFKQLVADARENGHQLINHSRNSKKWDRNHVGVTCVFVLFDEFHK